MQTEKVAGASQWRDWLAWEISPLVGGVARFAIELAIGHRAYHWGEAFGKDFFVAVVLFWIISVPLMLVGYFGLAAFRIRSTWSYALVGGLLGAGVFANSSPFDVIFLNGVSGMLTGTTFGLIRQWR